MSYFGCPYFRYLHRNCVIYIVISTRVRQVSRLENKRHLNRKFQSQMICRITIHTDQQSRMVTYLTETPYPHLIDTFNHIFQWYTSSDSPSPQLTGAGSHIKWLFLTLSNSLSLPPSLYLSISVSFSFHSVYMLPSPSCLINIPFWCTQWLHCINPQSCHCKKITTTIRSHIHQILAFQRHACIVMLLL